MVSEHWKFKNKFNYTASGMMQQNSYAEMGFTALASMLCEMMNKANIPRAVCYKLFGKVSKTANKSSSLVIVEFNGVKKICVKHYAGKIPLWVTAILLST